MTQRIWDKGVTKVFISRLQGGGGEDGPDEEG